MTQLTPPTSPTPARQVNESIQGLRGIAALSVVLYHLHYMSAKAGFTIDSGSSWTASVGPYAVTLFFCISGYLIISTLAKHGSVSRFAWNRVARVYPLFLILHLVMFTVGPQINYEWMGQLRQNGWAYAGHFLSNLLFLPGVLALPIAQKNAWSLSFEAAFYITICLVFAGRQRWPTLVGKAMFLVGGVVCVTACLLDTRYDYFAIGVLVWWLEKRGSLKFAVFGPMGLLGLIAGLLCYASECYWLGMMAVIPFFIDVVREAGWLAPILRTKFIGWLGKVSYSLYLVHPFILDPLRRLATKFESMALPGVAHTVFVISGVTFALVAAGLVHEYIELRLTSSLVRR